MSGLPSPIAVTSFIAHARNVASEAREKFAASALALQGDPRAMVLHTCHRVELYVADPDDGSASGEPPCDPPIPKLPAGGRVLHGDAAARHLFTVAAGLDSVVVGEDQVLHQLRECLAGRQLAALEESDEQCAEGRRPRLGAERPGELAPILDRMFQLALHVGRQSRSWREEAPRSLADVALDRIEASRPAGDRPVLIVGAGQIGRLAALAAARRGTAVLVSTRTPEHAARLAVDAGGTTAAFGAIPDGLAGVIVALGGEWTLAASAATTLVHSAATVVDLSSPPAVGSAIRAALGARFVSVDDIARVPMGGLRPRHRRRIEGLLDEAVAELSRWAAARDAVPAIRALTERAESRRAAEIERLLRRLPDLPEHERDLVDHMSRRLVAGILHAPLNSLRDDQDGARDHAARELFGL
ncbi:MAG TPA: hypothetical protein VJK49_01880 [Candidatus Limnocylindrales bacterium]|nr:hypothetical protein [Candidatus Limnocylindrales bacterium]